MLYYYSNIIIKALFFGYIYSKSLFMCVWILCKPNRCIMNDISELFFCSICLNIKFVGP